MTTPTIQPHLDDAQKAEAVVTDLLKFMQHFRVGLFARQGPSLCIAISEPHASNPMAHGIQHDTQSTPSQRRLVTHWVDMQDFAYLGAHFESGARCADILEAIRQTMAHYNSALIPAPVLDEPTMVLCDQMPNGQWRAYAVIAELDLYGFTWRPVKAQVAM